MVPVSVPAARSLWPPQLSVLRQVDNAPIIQSDIANQSGATDAPELCDFALYSGRQRGLTY